MNIKRGNAGMGICRAFRYNLLYLMLIIFPLIFMGMGLSAGQQEVYRDPIIAETGNKVVAASSMQEDTNKAGYQAYVCASSDSYAEQKLILELEPTSPSKKWEAVYHAIENCVELDLTVWYSFGSLRLKIQLEGNQCRMNLLFEGELTESNGREGFTCLGDPAVFKELDLVHDKKALRSGPPTELPEALKTFCKPLPLNP